MSAASQAYAARPKLANMWFKMIHNNQKVTKQFHSALAPSYVDKKASSSSVDSIKPGEQHLGGRLLSSTRNDQLQMITFGQQSKRLLSNDGSSSSSSSSSSQDDNNGKDSIFACWKCGKSRDVDKEIFFCFCGTILPPSDTANYFDMVGMKQNFELDTEALTKKYKDLQRILHPDKFSQRSKKEKTYSAEQSSLVNLAYTSLLKPLSRGLYMLSIHGETLEEGTQCEDVEFLMKIMEINEDLEQATSEESLRVIEKLNTRNINQCYEILSEAFRQKDLVGAKEVVIKLKYFTTIDNKIKELELYQQTL